MINQKCAQLYVIELRVRDLRERSQVRAFAT
jgi:hypothetical protein